MSTPLKVTSIIFGMALLYVGMWAIQGLTGVGEGGTDGLQAAELESILARTDDAEPALLFLSIPG